MVSYRYLLVDASSGSNLGELPLTVESFSYLLNGCGQLTGTLPLDHPMATYQNLLGDREITVVREDLPVWNGPVVTPEGALSTRAGQVTAREASWYLSKRTLEINKNFNADLYYIFRWLVTYMTTKTSNGTTGGSNINAALPRFSVSPSSGSSGTAKQVRYYGGARHLISDIVDDLVADPTTGLDYRMDYSAGSTLQTCHRTLTLGVPLGTTRTQRITEHLVREYTRTLDRERAATRVHVLGAGYTATAQNSGSVTNGDILIESVFDRSDKANHTFLDNYARDARYRSQPPVVTHQVSFTPGSALPFGFANVGDKVQMEMLTDTSLLLHDAEFARVMEIDVQPESGDATEVVTLTLATSLDSLGS